VHGLPARGLKGTHSGSQLHASLTRPRGGLHMFSPHPVERCNTSPRVSLQGALGAAEGGEGGAAAAAAPRGRGRMGGRRLSMQ
jgi:hypothetical protein